MRRMLVVALMAMGVVALGAGPAWAITTARVSRDAAGVEGKAPSQDPEVNTDGRFVVFESLSALVPNDTNDLQDIYLKNMVTGGIIRVSEDTAGGDADGASYDPAISADARFVAYSSDATDLISNDLNAVRDVFIFDTVSGNTQLASVGPGGVQGNAPSNHPKVSAAPNPVVVFDSLANFSPADANGVEDVYARVVGAGVTALVSSTPGGSAGNGPSTYPDITPNATRIAFESRAFDLTPDVNGPISDVFVFRPSTGAVLLISVASNGTQGNADSGRPDLSTALNGQFVAFHSDATNLVQIDLNNERDVFWHNVANGVTRLASVTAAGGQGNGPSQNPSIDPDGVWVAYESTATNVVPGDTNAEQDIFLRLMTSGFVARISVDSSGTQADGPSSTPATAANGGNPIVAYDSDATNLVPFDNNEVTDVFEFRP